MTEQYWYFNQNIHSQEISSLIKKKLNDEILLYLLYPLTLASDLNIKYHEAYFCPPD